MTEQSIHDQLAEINRSIGRQEGKLESFIMEVRAVFTRADNGARAQDDRMMEMERRTGALESAAYRAQGAKDHRTVLGHLVTGVLSAGAAIAAIWSGAFHAPH